ncbi:hypothetical protein EON63_01765 [archaeon]|nr:MAG: hypothetical protein EON63_01765 [archaeon]
MFGPYSTWMTHLPTTTHPTPPGIEKVKRKTMSDRDSMWRRAQTHGFHQNPSQPWQYYLDRSCKELESLLGKKPAKTQHSSEDSSSLNLGKDTYMCTSPLSVRNYLLMYAPICVQCWAGDKRKLTLLNHTVL